jgi:hypothetical protein
MTNLDESIKNSESQTIAREQHTLLNFFKWLMKSCDICWGRCLCQKSETQHLWHLCSFLNSGEQSSYKCSVHKGPNISNIFVGVSLRGLKLKLCYVLNVMGHICCAMSSIQTNLHFKFNTQCFGHFRVEEIHDFRLPPRSKWDLRSSGLLHSANWQLLTCQDRLSVTLASKKHPKKNVWLLKTEPMDCPETSVCHLRRATISSGQPFSFCHTIQTIGRR